MIKHHIDINKLTEANSSPRAICLYLRSEALSWIVWMLKCLTIGPYSSVLVCFQVVVSTAGMCGCTTPNSTCGSEWLLLTKAAGGTKWVSCWARWEERDRTRFILGDYTKGDSKLIYISVSDSDPDLLIEHSYHLFYSKVPKWNNNHCCFPQEKEWISEFS